MNVSKVMPLNYLGVLGKIPRDYQEKSVREIVHYLKQGFKRICVKMPTGCGKTFTSKLIALSTEVREVLDIPLDRPVRVLYITTKNRLSRQAIEEYADNKDNIELITQSAFSGISEDVLEDGWDYTLIDECHHEAMISIQLMLEKLSVKPIFGMTAEDRRGDGSLIKFERVVVAITEHEASARGFIEKAGINSVIDMSGNNKADLTAELIVKYHKHMGNSLVFLKTSSECKKVLARLTEEGIAAEFLQGGTTEKEMDLALDRLSRSEIRFLINCQKLGEGVDILACTDVILARQFNSLAEKKQYVGRSIRPDSPCAVWEFINPIKDTVVAVDVVGETKYERVIHLYDDQWTEQLISGTNEGWGELGAVYDEKGLAYALEQQAEEKEEEVNTLGLSATNPSFLLGLPSSNDCLASSSKSTLIA